MVTLLFASVPVLLESSAYASAVIHIDPNTVATTTAMAQTSRWKAFALPEKRPRTEAGTTMVVFPSVQCKSVIFSTLAAGIGNNGRHISAHCFRKGATMPQYQVCILISTPCRTYGEVRRPPNSPPWRLNGERRSNKWRLPWSPFNVRWPKPPTSMQTRRRRHPVCLQAKRHHRPAKRVGMILYACFV